ncbi:MAG: hypothetical protein OEV00_00345 [Acidobacteriota bacterium]|nr:hypothetical protein [Acidobacteriota bacterium]MDH3783753.1 hypothetical protein [Acidobacteriota bacterium]
MKKTLGIVSAVVIAVTGVVFLVGPTTIAQEFDEVVVRNFPAIQRIVGDVEVTGVIDMAELTSIQDVLVPPVRLDETTRLVDAGIIKTEGFPYLVLSLHGEVKGQVQQTGEVGVVLLPEQPRIRQAFNEQGLLHFSLRATANKVTPSSSFFASDQPRYTVGFQAYRAYVYNTTNKAVTVDLFAYLTN